MNELSKASEVAERIDLISDLVSCMKTMPQVETPVEHHFSDGVYAREIFMHAGLVAVGKIHKTRHLNIVSQGSCSVVTPTRKFEVVAPYTFESDPGEQKVVFIHEDTVWTTIHVTDSTDLSVIEEECIAKEYNEELVQKLIGDIQ